MQGPLHLYKSHNAVYNCDITMLFSLILSSNSHVMILLAEVLICKMCRDLCMYIVAGLLLLEENQDISCWEHGKKCEDNHK